jgi:hypothetical protein
MARNLAGSMAAQAPAFVQQVMVAESMVDKTTTFDGSGD